MKCVEGQDAEGNYAVKIKMGANDPLADHLRALAHQGAHASVDATGFRAREPGDEGAADDLVLLLKDMLPVEVRANLERSLEEQRLTGVLGSVVGGDKMAVVKSLMSALKPKK